MKDLLIYFMSYFIDNNVFQKLKHTYNEKRTSTCSFFFIKRVSKHPK